MPVAVYNMSLYNLKHVILSHPFEKHEALSTNMGVGPEKK